MIDIDYIYSDPELEWPWHYTNPDTAFSETEAGVNMSIINGLSRVQDNFWIASFGFIFWGGLVFGDLYGNRGVNLNGYYLWSALLYVMPQWWELFGQTFLGL